MPWLESLLAVSLLAAGAGYYSSPSTSDEGAAIPEKSIAVLPLVNSTGDPANEYFSDGMSEEFISSLSRLQRPQGHRAHLVVSVQRQDGGQQDDRRKTRRLLSARRQRAEIGRSGAHRGGAGQIGRWRQCLVGNLRPGTEGHLRGAIGDCRRGGEAAQGRAARQQRADRAVGHRGHAFEPECRGLQRPLAGKFLLRAPHRGGYPQSDRLLRGGDPARPALRAGLCEALDRGGDSGQQLHRQYCDERKTRGDRKSPGRGGARARIWTRISPKRIGPRQDPAAISISISPAPKRNSAAPWSSRRRIRA